MSDDDADFDSNVQMTDEERKVRKRANLDHLSAEEKMMRRKLKNRVAAQVSVHRDVYLTIDDDMSRIGCLCCIVLAQAVAFILCKNSPSKDAFQIGPIVFLIC